MNTPNNAAALERLDMVIGSLRNFADVADRCVITEVVNSIPAMRVWAEELSEIRATLAQPDALTSQPSGEAVAEVKDNPDDVGTYVDTFVSLPVGTKLFTHPSADAPGVAVDELREIGELIRTQNNRITDSPIFIVQQKRRIYGIEDGYSDNYVWIDGESTYTDEEKAARDAERSEDELPPAEYRQCGYIDIWEFVTACFTEHGCKDYLRKNAHNLREPRIYAEGSFRNQEWRTVRSYLAALAPKPEGEL